MTVIAGPTPSVPPMEFVAYPTVGWRQIIAPRTDLFVTTVLGFVYQVPNKSALKAAKREPYATLSQTAVFLIVVI